MFSTLSDQKSLISLPLQRVKGLLRKNYLQRHKMIFLARNPYARIVSSYFDKFVYNPQDPDYPIQNCQKLYLRHLGMFEENEPIAKTKEKLMQISFQQFMENLNELCMEDYHFVPQTSLHKGQLSRFDRFEIKLFHLINYQVFRMETDLTGFFDELALNPGVHHNKTDHGAFTEYFTPEYYAQVNKIYADDFKYLKYDKVF